MASPPGAAVAAHTHDIDTPKQMLNLQAVCQLHRACPVLLALSRCDCDQRDLVRGVLEQPNVLFVMDNLEAAYAAVLVAHDETRVQRAHLDAISAPEFLRDDAADGGQDGGIAPVRMGLLKERGDAFHDVVGDVDQFGYARHGG
ncbi:hypothetical protein PG985_012078 [Apiospora marii]|uniref:uncharacterized protein n=1 Tax=Apiospora marii TaxID=335849 RepID=UPI00313199C7